jgi:hypothetical protein
MSKSNGNGIERTPAYWIGVWRRTDKEEREADQAYQKAVERARERHAEVVEEARKLRAEADAMLGLLVPCPGDAVLVRSGPSYNGVLLTIGRDEAGAVYVAERTLRDDWQLAFPEPEPSLEPADNSDDCWDPDDRVAIPTRALPADLAISEG